MNEHEQSFLGFLTDRSRRRLSAMLELGPRRRDDFRESLIQAEFDPRWKEALIGESSTPTGMLEALRRRGAPELCFVLSCDAKLDGQELPLSVALEWAASAGDGSFISCVPERLGFYEGFKAHYVLAKPDRR